MKAIVYTEYGSPEVLKLKEIEKPAPKDDEVQIQIRAVNINYGDLLARNFKNTPASEFNMPFLFWLIAKLDFGLKKPKKTILGNSFAGKVAAVGKNVKRFQPGDDVFGYTGQAMGAYVEYLCVSENACILHKPTNTSYEEAAVIPYGALMAMGVLNKVNLSPGKKILINGASGGIGSAAVQIAKAAGAEVTGVCGTPRLDFVRALGADTVIDYKTEDFTKKGETYDVILDILGKSNLQAIKPVLKEDGIYLLASFKLKHIIQMIGTSLFGKRKVQIALAAESLDALKKIKDLTEQGKLKVIIDRSFDFTQADEAHAYVESGQKQGDVVIRVI